MGSAEGQGWREYSIFGGRIDETVMVAASAFSPSRWTRNERSLDKVKELEAACDKAPNG